MAALDNLSWPVSGADGGGIYALRGRQVIRLTESNGAVTLVGGEASWRRLIGIDDGALLGFVADGPFGRPAIMSPAGVISIGSPPQTEEDRMRHAVLLQDSRTYADGRRLVVRPSGRGGRGLDVFIELDGSKPTNLSDCGDDFCGQPSLSADGTRVLWIRSPPSDTADDAGVRCWGERRVAEPIIIVVRADGRRVTGRGLEPPILPPGHSLRSRRYPHSGNNNASYERLKIREVTKKACFVSLSSLVNISPIARYDKNHLMERLSET